MAEVKIGDEKYPNNSYRAAAEVPANDKTPRKFESVVKESQKKKKQGFFDRLGQTFFEEDSKSVGDYIIWDVLVPAAKETINDMVVGSMKMLLFRERPNSSRLRREQGRTIVSYNSMFNRDDSPIRRSAGRGSSRYNFDDILMSKGEAEKILDTMLEAIDQYEVVSVGDFFDLANVPTEHTDYKYGWVDLSRASVERTRDGYCIDLPRPRVIE